MTAIKRYSFAPDGSGYKDDDGQFVFYHDHKKEIEQFKEEMARYISEAGFSVIRNSTETFDGMLDVVKDGGMATRPNFDKDFCITRYKDTIVMLNEQTGYRHPYQFTNEDLFADDWKISGSTETKVITEKEKVKQLGEQLGYGQMMKLASELWEEYMIAHGYPTKGLIEENKQLRGLLTDAKYVIQNNYPPMNGKKVLDRIEELLKSKWMNTENEELIDSLRQEIEQLKGKVLRVSGVAFEQKKEINQLKELLKSLPMKFRKAWQKNDYTFSDGKSIELWLKEQTEQLKSK